MSKQRLIYIDIAKAIAIILVVIGHYYPENHPIWYEQMRNVIYSFHMPLFMFASGFVYIATLRRSTYGNFILKKVKRLMVPYFTVSVLIISIKLVTQGHTYVENPVTPMSYLKILYLPEAGYFLWFIWALWWMFVIIPIFNTPYKRLALVIVALLMPLVESYMPEEFCIKQFFQMFQYFVLGIVVFDWKNNLMWIKCVPLWIVFVVFCLVEILPYYGYEMYSLLPALIGIGFVLKLSFVLQCYVKKSLLGTVILTISSASYIIYLLHTTFEGMAKALVLKTPYISNCSNDWMFTMGAFIVILTGVIVPIILYKYVLGNSRITRFLFGLK